VGEVGVDAHHGGEVDHGVDALDERGDDARVTDVALDHLHLRRDAHPAARVEGHDAAAAPDERPLRRFAKQPVCTREENAPYHCGLSVTSPGLNVYAFSPSAAR
jgi:hypothetical protein